MTQSNYYRMLFNKKKNKQKKNNDKKNAAKAKSMSRSGTFYKKMGYIMTER